VKARAHYPEGIPVAHASCPNRTRTRGAILGTRDPHARDRLRAVLIRDQANRDAIASDLLRYRDTRGDDWADIIDMRTMHPEARRKALRLLGEIEAVERR
jgi:hypothetical protein